MSPTKSYEDFKKWVENVDFTRLLHHPVEIITSFWFFAPNVRRNKYFSELARMLGNPSSGHMFSMIGCAFHFLFQKTPAFEERLLAARASFDFKPDVPKIGIHVRLGDLPSFGRQSRRDVRTTDFVRYFTCALQMQRAISEADPNIAESDIKWFLATDNNDVKKYALENYPYKVRTLAIKIEHIALQKPSEEGLVGVLLDNFLLSESDFLIMSQSSFSKTALGLNFLSLEHDSTYGEKCLH